MRQGKEIGDPSMDPVLNGEYRDDIWEIINGENSTEAEKEIELMTSGIDTEMLGASEQIRAMARMDIEVFQVLEERLIEKEWKKFVVCESLKNDKKRTKEVREVLAKFSVIQSKRIPDIYKKFGEIYRALTIEKAEEKIEDIDICKVLKYW